MNYYRIKVFGRVQGVAFRHYTKLKADDLTVTGWVKNLEDGNVMIECAGDHKQLIQFLDWCHLGPSAADVIKLEYKVIAPFSVESFQIIR